MFVSHSSSSSLSAYQFSTIPFDSVIVTPLPPVATYNLLTRSYKCLTGGIYLSSVSVGVESGRNALVALADQSLAINFKFARKINSANDLTTLSRLDKIMSTTTFVMSSIGDDLGLAGNFNVVERNVAM